MCGFACKSRCILTFVCAVVALPACLPASPFFPDPLAVWLPLLLGHVWSNHCHVHSTAEALGHV